MILGPYGKCKRKLTALKNHLINKGFSSARLVTDFPSRNVEGKDPDIYFLEKSHDCIENWAEILVFVFDEDKICNNDSVFEEFFFTAGNVSHKCRYSSILSSSMRFAGRLLRGTYKLHHIPFREFKNVGELKRRGYSAVYGSFQKLP